MAVRIKIKIENIKNGASVEVIALLNSGFETDTPQVLMPTRVAELLGLLPDLPDEAVITRYETAGAMELETRFLRDWLKVSVLTEDQKSNQIISSAVISEQERETILSDSLFSALNIAIEDAARGKWRFRDESHIRDSFKKQLW